MCIYSIVNINCIKIENNKNPGNFKFSYSDKIKTHVLIFYVSSSCCYDFLHTIWHGIR